MEVWGCKDFFQARSKRLKRAAGHDSMTAETLPTHCTECGAALPAPGAPCPSCSSAFVIWRRSRAVFLSVCGLMLLPMFTVTGLAVRLFHAKQGRIAEEWRAAGEANLKAGQPQVAIEDFRNALLYSPDNRLLQLELAQKLMDENQADEAQNYLLNLRARDPEDAEVNLELARIETKHGNVDEATRYYHDAMYGHWEDERLRHRLAARSELIEFFLEAGRRDSARSEALAMAAENPADPDVRVAAGNFLLRAGDATNALAEFERALRLDTDNTGAFAGAGQAALGTGNFAQAAKYLGEAIALGAKDAALEQQRDVASAAAEMDPFMANLTDAERQRRVLGIFEAAEGRAKSCLPGMLAEKAEAIPENLRALATERAALPKRIGNRELGRDPGLEKKVLSWSLDTERAAAAQCGPGDAKDRAIALISAKNR